MTPLLSILICTVAKRAALFSRVYIQIAKQLTDEVECLVHCDTNVLKTGSKRNLLIERARGKYVVFIDDDDHISKHYIKNILSAARQDPDAIGITGIYTHDYHFKQRFVSSNQAKYLSMIGPKFAVRKLGHITPVRREFAKQAIFPDIYHGEDYFYSSALEPLIKTEIMAEGSLYWYDYRPNQSESIIMDIKDNQRGWKLGFGVA